MKFFNILFMFTLCCYAQIKDTEDILNLKKFGYSEQQILEVIKKQGGIYLDTNGYAQLKKAGFSGAFLSKIKKRISPSIATRLKKFYQSPLTPEAENICALVIAVDKYKATPLPRLPHAKKDAQEFIKFLLSVGVPAKQIHFLYGSHATSENIKKTVEHIKLKNKMLYFFYSGHGLYSNRTGFFFSCNNTYIDQLETTAYGISEFNHSLQKIKNKAVLFLDISHSHQIKNMSNTSVEKVTLGSALEQNAYNAISNLKQNSKPLLVITSCEAKQVSQRNKKGSIFIDSLLTGLKGKADQNKDKRVSLKEMFEFINGDIPSKSYLTQRPSYSFSNSWLWSKEKGFMYRPKKTKHFNIPYQIILDGAQYQKRKKNGKKWDIGLGKTQWPDSFVCISVPDEDKWEIAFTSKVKKNQLTPSWKQKTRVYVFPGNKIGIDIWDKDLRKNDLIASKIYTVTIADIDRGFIEMDLKAAKLLLRFKAYRAQGPKIK